MLILTRKVETQIQIGPECIVEVVDVVRDEEVGTFVDLAVKYKGNETYFLSLELGNKFLIGEDIWLAFTACRKHAEVRLGVDALTLDSSLISRLDGETYKPIIEEGYDENYIVEDILSRHDR